MEAGTDPAACRLSACARNRGSRGRRGAGHGAGRAATRAHRPGDDAGGALYCARDRRRDLADADPARLSRGRLGAATRHRAARRRAVGHHDGDHGSGDLRDRVVRAGRLQRAGGHPGSTGPHGVLDAADGRLDGIERGLARRRPVHAVCRAGTADLQRGAAGVAGRSRGDARCCAALPAVRAARFGAVPAGRGAALRWLRHTRYRAAVRPGSRRAGRLGGGCADDGRADCQDRAVPAASLAATCACRCAGGRQRAAVGAGGQGVVHPDRPDLVRHDPWAC